MNDQRLFQDVFLAQYYGLGPSQDPSVVLDYGGYYFQTFDNRDTCWQQRLPSKQVGLILYARPATCLGRTACLREAARCLHAFAHVALWTVSSDLASGGQWGGSAVAECPYSEAALSQSFLLESSIKANSADTEMVSTSGCLSCTLWLHLGSQLRFKPIAQQVAFECSTSRLISSRSEKVAAA